MKVQTDLKSGVSLASLTTQAENVAGQLGSFFGQAGQQADAVSEYLGDQFNTIWNTIFG